MIKREQIKIVLYAFALRTVNKCGTITAPSLPEKHSWCFDERNNKEKKQNMGSVIGRVRDFLIHCIENLQQSPQIFICLVLLNLPYVMQHAFELQGAAGISAVEYMRSILSAFLRTVFFAFFLDLLLKSIPFARLRHFIQAIVLSVSGILFLLDTFTFISYHCVVDGGMLIALLATNPREASEFLAMYVLQERYVLGTAAILVLLTIFHYALLRFIRHKVLLIVLLLLSFACSLKFVLYLSHYSSLARYGTMFTKIMKEKREYDLMNARIATQEIVLTKNESSILMLFLCWENQRLETTWHYTGIGC